MQFPTCASPSIAVQLESSIALTNVWSHSVHTNLLAAIGGTWITFINVCNKHKIATIVRINRKSIQSSDQLSDVHRFEFTYDLCRVSYFIGVCSNHGSIPPAIIYMTIDIVKITYHHMWIDHCWGCNQHGSCRCNSQPCYDNSVDRNQFQSHIHWYLYHSNLWISIICINSRHKVYNKGWEGRFMCIHCVPYGG